MYAEARALGHGKLDELGGGLCAGDVPRVLIVVRICRLRFSTLLVV
jgi:hypothetical protein